MEHERQIKQIKKAYTAIIKRLVNPSFKFNEGGATTKALNKFIAAVEAKHGSLSDTRVVDICVYLAYSFRDKLLPEKSTFSVSLLSRYDESKRGQRFYENQWLGSAGIDRQTILDLISDKQEHPLAGFIYMPSEEPKKQRLYNQRSGFVTCQAATTGWSPLSDSCKGCTFISDCKLETKRKFPELYRIRTEYGDKAN